MATKPVLYRPVNDDRKRVTIYANGRLNDGKALIVPPTFVALLAEAGRKLKLTAQRLFDIEGKEVKTLNDVKPHHLLFVSEGANFVPPVKIDKEAVRQREEARAEEELRAKAARRHQETMARIAEEERRLAEEENAAEAKRGPLTASTHAQFVDQQFTELEILRNFYGDLRVSRSLPQRIMVRLNPIIEDDSRLRLEKEDVSYSVLLVFMCGLRYPKEAPTIEVRWSGLRASLTDLQHAMLQTLLDTKAADLRGTMMLTELIDAAQLWLTGLALNKLKELKETKEEVAVKPVSTVVATEVQKRVQESEARLLKQFFSWKYECLKPDAILELQEHEVSYVATQLECDEDLATRLLHHFKWNSQSVLEAFAQSEGDMDAVLAATGVHPSKECPPLDFATASSKIACATCFEDFRVEKLTALSCGHWFCVGCWANYLKLQINEGRYDITCPALKCKVPVDDLTIASLVDRPLFKRYITFGLRSLVQANSNLVWCPNKRGCDNAILSEEGTATVTCDCGLIFCHQCQEPWHWPATCAMNKWWIDKFAMRRRQAEEDIATQEWIRSNSKDCPSCMSPIEKNEGCNHMTCKNCRYEFCWICLVDWTPFHYSCKPSDAKKAMHRSATLENYSFLSLYVLESHNKAQIDTMRMLLPGQTEIRIAAGLLKPEQGAVIIQAFQLAAFGRELFMNSCAMGQYLYTMKLPGQRKAKTMCHMVKMTVDILFDLLNSPEKKLPLMIGELQSFMSAMQGNLTRLKIDMGSIKKQLTEREHKLALPRKVKHVIVRTPTKAGGKQIERPTSLAALLSGASGVLGIPKAVVARDQNGNKLTDEHMGGLRNGETVFVYTAGDE